MADAPEKIWLQRPCRDPENEWCGDVTWCADKQNEDDTEYVRADLANGPEPVEPDWLQHPAKDWKGVDGAIAWHFIDRHADGWADVGRMMNEWLAANQTPNARVQPTAQER